MSNPVLFVLLATIETSKMWKVAKKKTKKNQKKHIK